MNERSIGYFSMEIALDEPMPTYAGGLGVLAGDTIRSSAATGQKGLMGTPSSQNNVAIQGQFLPNKGWQFPSRFPSKRKRRSKELCGAVEQSMDSVDARKEYDDENKESVLLQKNTTMGQDCGRWFGSGSVSKGIND